MPCYSPLKAYRRPGKGSDGRLSISFTPVRSFVDTGFSVPCGQCIGCRLERSRQWAIRCVHEAQLYDDNCFITLTYSDENLPPYNSLNLRHTQLFLKRLRKKFGSGIRFFLCGEYGETTSRPHYHALLFNFDFADKRRYSLGSDGNPLYTSDSLDDLWGLGETKVGNVTFQSAAYVARYAVKKVTGRSAAAHYGQRKPEFATQSRRPGIGARWLELYQGETYRDDFVVVNGSKMLPPKAYDRRLAAADPELYRAVRSARVRKASQHADNQTPERLRVRETVKLAQVTQLKRNL